MDMSAELTHQTGLAPSSYQKTGRKKTKVHSDTVLAWIFSLVPLLGFVLFSVFPIIISGIAMFTDMDIYAFESFKWNAYEGFRLVFDADYSALQTVDVHSLFMHSIGITVWIASAQLITLAIALVISVCLAQKMKGSKLLQVLFFMPNVISGVAIAIMWVWIYDKDGGILNTILGTQKDWLHTESTITWCIIVAIIWQAPAYGIVMFRSAFANVDNALYEAADLDGANLWNKTIHVTIPSIMPTIFYLLMAGVGAGLLTYDMSALLVSDGFSTADVGGTGHAGLTMMRLIYYLMSDNVMADRYSYMSAAAIIAWVLFFATAILSIIVYRIRERQLKND